MKEDFFDILQDDPHIDLTALIDCLFMLIIFFVLTMRFAQPVIEIVLPQASSAETVDNRNDITVSVKADGTLWLDKDTMTDLAGLERALDAEPGRLLNIYMDRKAPFDSFVSVVDLAKAKRNGRFVISTKPKGSSAPEATDAAAGEKS